MGEGRQELAWTHTAEVCATVARAHGAKVRAEDINPYARQKRSVDIKAWRGFRERAKQKLPDKLSEEEIWTQWERIDAG